MKLLHALQIALYNDCGTAEVDGWVVGTKERRRQREDQQQAIRLWVWPCCRLLVCVDVLGSGLWLVVGPSVSLPCVSSMLKDVLLSSIISCLES